eukprot:scaffold4845_cov98-Isochrysis_galbana.AAC.2
MAGPMVEPQPESALTANSCVKVRRGDGELSHGDVEWGQGRRGNGCAGAGVGQRRGRDLFVDNPGKPNRGGTSVSRGHGRESERNAFGRRSGQNQVVDEGDTEVWLHAAGSRCGSGLSVGAPGWSGLRVPRTAGSMRRRRRRWRSAGSRCA